jgi:hypothetical protein
MQLPRAPQRNDAVDQYQNFKRAKFEQIGALICKPNALSAA